MEHPFDKSNCRWLLLAFYRTNTGFKRVPIAIFDRPEDCFEKYPGNWHKLKEDPYFLRVLPKIENYKEAQY